MAVSRARLCVRPVKGSMGTVMIASGVSRATSSILSHTLSVLFDQWEGGRTDDIPPWRDATMAGPLRDLSLRMAT